MSVCAYEIRMVCKKNTSDLYWFGPKNALHPVRRRVLYCLAPRCL
jgi:hypothetical protein